MARTRTRLLPSGLSVKTWEASTRGRRRDLAGRRCGSSQADAAEAARRSAGAAEAEGAEAPAVRGGRPASVWRQRGSAIPENHRNLHNKRGNSIAYTLY